MEKLKTICSDIYGMETSKEMQDLMDRHSNKIYEVAKDFAEDCVRNNVEYCSAYGIFSTIAMGKLTAAYGKLHSQNIQQY